MKIPPALHPGHTAVLDTNILIYLFEDHPQFGPLAEYVIDQIASGSFAGLVTPVTVAELLVKPLQQDRKDIAQAYRRALSHLKGVQLTHLDSDMGAMAGALRAQYGFPLPDMLQAAVAMRHPNPILITQDARLKNIEELRVYSLNDFAD